MTVFGYSQGDRPMLAIGFLMVGVFTLAFQDSLVKLMSSQTSLWQFQALRSVGNLLIAGFLALVSGGLILLKPLRVDAVYLRAGFLTICMFFFFAGAPHLSLSQMAAGLYTYPVFVSLLAGRVLGEQVGPWRIGAILVGAMGALVVLSPWRAGFSSIQLLPVLAGFFYACNILTLRRACRNESPLALAFAVALLFVVSGSIGSVMLTWFPLDPDTVQRMPFVAVGWPELTLLVVGFALLASVLNLTGNICMTRAYQTADASMLAPLDFSYLLFAAIWSRLLFDQWPTFQALTGMLLIALAGIITTWRERVAQRGQVD